MNPQYRTKIIQIWKCRKCHKDYDNYKDASKCCTENSPDGWKNTCNLYNNDEITDEYGY